MEQERYRELADKLLKGIITTEEMAEYAEWYNREESAELEIPETIARTEEEHGARLLQKISPRRGRYVALGRAAAVVLIIAGAATGGAIWWNKNTTPDISAALPRDQRYKNDIDPAKGSVILTIGDGKQLLLDTLQNGQLAISGARTAVKGDGTLQYKPHADSDKVAYNQLSTSKGRTYRLMLPDGTNVWLDAQSSIRFPSVFTGHERNVEVTGQAYFEVAKNARQPFKITTASQTIEVLGTHFNVNAYEPGAKTTLLEGSIKVSTGAHAKIIRPGEQAIVQAGGLITTMDIDTDEIMAWRSGRFKFTGNSITDIMRQLERWYDIEVVYKEPLPEMQLVAKIDRNMPISKILNLLEMTGLVTFIIENNKVTIMKGK